MIKRLTRLFGSRANALLAAGLLIVCGIPLFAYLRLGDNPDDASARVATVERRSFDLRVSERGVVRPARIVPVKSSIMSNQAKLIWFREEGAAVNAGDVIARFDTKPFRDQLLAAKQDLLDAEARLKSTEKTIGLQKEENAGKLEAARRKLETAEIKAANMVGDAKLKKEKYSLEIKNARRDLKLAKEELDDFDQMLRKGYVSKRERDRARNRYLGARENLEYVRSRMKNFEANEWPRIQHEAELTRAAAQEEMNRIQRTNHLEMERLEVKLAKERREVSAKRAQVETAQRNLQNCVVKAPAGGTLLHVEIPRPSGKRKIQVGDDIWMNQMFMEIAETNDLVVETMIREIDVAKLRPGMPAEIRLDAMPDQTLTGKLVSVAALPREDRRSGGVRRFPARISIEKTAPGLHVGMSASVAIRYKRLEHVLTIPVNALDYVDGAPMVRKIGPDGDIISTRVEVGDVGDEWVEIRNGLKEGDKVLAGQP